MPITRHDDLIPTLERTLTRHAGEVEPADRSDEIVSGALTFPLSGAHRDSRRPMVWLAAAAVAALGVAGTVAVTALRDDAAPATQPSASPPGSSPPVAAALEYPVFGDLGDLNGSVYASGWRRAPDDPIRLSATIGKATENGYTDVVNVTVQDEEFDWPDDVTITPVVFANMATARFEGPDGEYAGYSWMGTASGGEIAIGDTSIAEQLRVALEPGVGADGLPTLSIGPLPAGYEVIDGPAVSLAESGPHLATDTELDHGLSLRVSDVIDAMGRDVTLVAVGDQQAFLVGPMVSAGHDDLATLYWRTPTGSWAQLTGYGSTAHQLPEIAAAITWVDLATFAATYDADPSGVAAPSLPAAPEGLTAPSTLAGDLGGVDVHFDFSLPITGTGYFLQPIFDSSGVVIAYFEPGVDTELPDAPGDINGAERASLCSRSECRAVGDL